MMQWQTLKVKSVVGSVAPPEPDATFHCHPIPQGYAVVMVDEITEGFEELELHHPNGEGETQLGLALKTPCLWRKEHIKLPNWTPSPPPASQCTTPPPPPPPASYQGTPPPSPAAPTHEGGNPPPSPPAPARPSSPPPPSPRQQWRK